MYKLIKTNDYTRTRNVILRNIETGTEDVCFDDSKMFDSFHKDFSFMEQGKKYDCKILLFGSLSSGTGQKALCRVLRNGILCGDTKLVEVFIGNDRYYILQDEIKDQLKNGEFDYYYTRKDLIQVNNIIHGAYLD